MKARILLFDNYDSFTYNLMHLVEKVIHTKVDVFRNDEVSMERVGDYDKIILSPGPGLPKDAGSLMALIKEYAYSKSILGVCLGHQAIAQSFGAKLKNIPFVYHGIATSCFIEEENGLFARLDKTITVGRYHSWVVDEETVPKELKVTAWDENGYVMAMRHTAYDLCGVQFHPESILTPDGETIMRNWLLN